MGADYQLKGGVIVGAAFTAGGLTQRFSAGGNFDQVDEVISLYAAYRTGPVWGNAVAGYGLAQYHVARQVPLGLFTDQNSADTNGRALALALRGGWDFNFGPVTTGLYSAWRCSRCAWMALLKPASFGTVTFLMSDIEGSTRRWADQPDSMRAALARHDEVIADAVESNGGWLFKHTGDGIVAAFGSARAAIDAAIAAQRRLELPVRMGICSGAAELRGDDYFGPALNRAARTMEVGHGGQILVAASTASLIESADLIDLGEHRLRDLSQPQRIWQARAAGLRRDFPPLRTLDAAAGNLPPQSTSFLGREHDIAEISAMVRRARLVTLTGVGGVGKTRLALQVAASVSPNFQGGSWQVQLASVLDPSATGHAVAAVFGVTSSKARPSSRVSWSRSAAASCSLYSTTANT